MFTKYLARTVAIPVAIMVCASSARATTSNFGILAQTSPPKNELQLGDLGFSKDETQANSELQTTLEKRRFMLKQHQLWGLVALGLLGTALLTGEEGHAPAAHIALGSATAATYGVSAYNALAAPDLPGGARARGASLWHARLGWIHGIGMIATPVLGYLAAKQSEDGEEISGIAAQHKNVAGVTAAALAISVALVSFEF